MAKIPKNTRFLIIEDSKHDFDVIKKYLIDYGIEAKFIEHAKEAESAWKRLNNGQLDQIQFIISDWHMLGESGLNFLKRIRDSFEGKIPFLMSTCEDEPRNILDAIENGVTNYLVKPWEREEFFRKLELSWS